MKLITNNDELRKYIPNSIREVKGETRSLTNSLPSSKGPSNGSCHHFVPAELLDAVASDAAHIVAVEAYRLAVPQLDLVLTPNGFATVGTKPVPGIEDAR